MNYNNIDFEAAYGLANQLPDSINPEIVFVGRSNVGKSSLINKLFNRKKLARVSSVPGKTITINFYNFDNLIKIVDLPGYGYAKLSKSEFERFSSLMEGYFNQERNIKLVILLIDMRHKLSKDDENMIIYLQDRQIPFIIAMTKADKLNKTEFNNRLESSKKELAFAKNSRIIPFSSINGLGCDEIKSCIENSVI